MYKVCLCDDIPEESARLSSLIRASLDAACLQYELTVFHQPDRLCAALDGGAGFDLFFLDIVMPQLSGMELARRIRKRAADAVIVFVSQSRDYAIEGYQVQALDYLLKPADAAGVARVLDRWLLGQRKRPAIAVRLSARGQVAQLEPPSVRYVEASGHYITFHLLDKPALKVLSSLEDYVPALTAHEAFVRCHKSFVVNLAHVSALRRNVFMLDGGEAVPISRLYQSAAKQCYCDFVLSQ